MAGVILHPFPNSYSPLKVILLMYLQNNELVFKTGRKISCIDGMYDISENGVFRALSYDNVITTHQLSIKERREVVQDLHKKIENLISF